MPNQYTNQSVAERFFSQVKYSNGCWEWIGTLRRDGYGKFGSNYKYYSSHRWSYEYFIGPLGGLLCCHHCDNKKCVNPFHLFAGTQKQNVKDCINKTRHATQLLKRRSGRFTKEFKGE